MNEEVPSGPTGSAYSAKRTLQWTLIVIAVSPFILAVKFGATWVAIMSWTFDRSGALGFLGVRVVDLANRCFLSQAGAKEAAPEGDEGRGGARA